MSLATENHHGAARNLGALIDGATRFAGGAERRRKVRTTIE